MRGPTTSSAGRASGLALLVALANSPPTHEQVTARFDAWRTIAARAAFAADVRVVCEASDAPARVGKFAAAQFATFGSTNQAMRAVRAGRLLINGKPCDHAAFVNAGDEVTLLPPSDGVSSTPPGVPRVSRCRLWMFICAWRISSGSPLRVASSLHHPSCPFGHSSAACLPWLGSCRYTDGPDGRGYYLQQQDSGKADYDEFEKEMRAMGAV